MRMSVSDSKKGLVNEVLHHLLSSSWLHFPAHGCTHVSYPSEYSRSGFVTAVRSTIVTVTGSDLLSVSQWSDRVIGLAWALGIAPLHSRFPL